MRNPLHIGIFRSGPVKSHRQSSNGVCLYWQARDTAPRGNDHIEYDYHNFSAVSPHHARDHGYAL